MPALGGPQTGLPPTPGAIPRSARAGTRTVAAHERIFVGMGANLGPAASTVLRAATELGGIAQTDVVALSSLYRSASVGASGPDYVNAVAEICSGLEPLQLLRALLAIEQAHGRHRPYPNAPRTLDLDLLFYGTREHHDASLTLPHPRVAQRAFVLAPLLELAPDGGWADGRSFAEALAALPDQRIERLPSEPGSGAGGAGGFNG